jgi:hypothetical protein
MKSASATLSCFGVALLLSCGTALPQTPNGVLLSENFENGSIDPRISITTRGTFTAPAGIALTSVLDGSHAFGFGKSSCHVNCWFDDAVFLTITFQGGTNISTLSFSSVELGGNWGSQGYIFIDPPILAATTNEAPQGVVTNAFGLFNSQPNNTATAASNYVFSIQRYVTNIVIMVEDITDISEIYVDDLLILAPPCPHRATAIATVVSGSVTAATITDSGCGYTNTPLVLIEGGGGTGAAGMAVVNNGVVSAIGIVNQGSGYTNAPNVYIYSPFGLQIGLLKAVKPTFSDLFIGTNYQLQTSTELSIWTNQGSPFTATNPVMTYPQYFDVDNWGKLLFRLQATP